MKKLQLTSSHWGTYRVETLGGKITNLFDFEEDSDPSPIGKGMLDTQEDSCRISSPMVRKSWLDKGFKSNRARRGLSLIHI